MSNRFLKHQCIIILLIVLSSCASPPAVKSGFDFSEVKTVVVYPTPDHKSFAGSGTITNKSIVYHLMKLGINMIERESTAALINEVSLNQTGLTDQNMDLKLTSSQVVLLCTITEFHDQEIYTIPVVTHDKGSITTTVKTVDEPVISKDKEGSESVVYETKTTKTTTEDKGFVKESELLEYVPARVGISIQLLSAENGDVLWTNTYWYSSISLSSAVNECVYGALKPLKKVLK